MEFPFSVGRFLSDKEQATGLGIAVYTAARFKGLQQALREKLSLIIDEMGEASAIAQDLKKVITNTEKLVASEDRLYMAFEGQNKAMGVLRMGKKRLFIRDEMGSISEIAPLCCLDFYVHESCQRKGVGKALFEFMLQCEHSEPSAIGYDRPSHKLLAFLEKHYRLYSYVPQANNFVVFKDYFQQHNPLINDKRSRQQLQQQMETANDNPQRGRRDISKSLASPSSPRYESESHESGAAVSRRNAQLSVSHVFPSSASVEKMNAAQSNGPSPYRDRQRGNNDGYATIRPNQNQSAFSEDNFPAVVSNRGVFKREQNALDKQFQDCDIFGNPARRVPPSRGGNSLSRAGYSTIGVPSASTRDRETRYDSRALPSEFSQAYWEEASLESYSKPSSPMALPIGKQGYMDSGKNDDSLSSLLTARRSVAPADEYFPEQRSRASTQREHVSDLFQSASENQNARFGGTTMRGGPFRRTAF